MTKMDLVAAGRRRTEIESFLDPDTDFILNQLDTRTTEKQHGLNRAIASLIDEYGMVRFVPLNPDDDDSVADALSHVDHCIQYGEDEEVRIPNDGEGGGEAEGGM